MVIVINPAAFSFCVCVFPWTFVNEYRSVKLNHNAVFLFTYMRETIGNKEERVCYIKGLSSQDLNPSHIHTTHNLCMTHTLMINTQKHASSPSLPTHTHRSWGCSGPPANGFTVGDQRLRQHGAGFLACCDIIESDRWGLKKLEGFL